MFRKDVKIRYNIFNYYELLKYVSQLALSLFYNNPLFKHMAPLQVHQNLRIFFGIFLFYLGLGLLASTCLRYVFKPTLAEGKNSIISRTMGSKLVKMVYKATSEVMQKVIKCNWWGFEAFPPKTSCLVLVGNIMKP